MVYYIIMKTTKEILESDDIDEVKERLVLYLEMSARLERCIHEMLKAGENELN